MSRLFELFDPLAACRSEREVFLVMANELSQHLAADQVLAWRQSPWGRPQLWAVAGVSRVERHTDFASWIEKLASHLRRGAETAVAAVPLDLGLPALQAERHLHLLDNMLHVRLSGPDGSLVGGVFAGRLQAFDAADIELLSGYAVLAGRSAWAWRRKAWLPVDGWAPLLARQGLRWVIGLAVLAAMFLPVRLSALASAEVTAREPVTITATQDGVVEKILVRPNQRVAAGEVLLRFDAAVVRNRLEVARRAVAVADAELRRASGKAFLDESSRAELQTLRARVQEKAAETQYLDELNARLQIKAPVAGLAVFTEPEAWSGRPVQTGERVMLIADPSKVWLTLYLPPEEDIPSRDQAPVTLNLDISPLVSIHATVVESSYEAGMTPEGRPAYVLRALLSDPQALPRIGLRGTATVYGDTTVLGYYLLRKPMRAARRLLGW